MLDPQTVRVLGLMVPVVATLGLWMWRQPDPKWRTGVLLATLWQIPPLVVFNLAAPQMEWWRFGPHGGELGLPMDLFIGWILLWGAVPALATPRLRPIWIVVIVLIFDVVVMPLCGPLVQLDARWLLGEALLLSFALIPGLLLARWTRDEVNLAGRTLLQVVCFSGLILGVLPAFLMIRAGEDIMAFFARPVWWNSLGVQVMLIPAVMGLSAVQEFVVRGRGTPLPFDPPERLVISGPYAYISNPMQSSILAMLVLWGVLLESQSTILASVMVLIFSFGLAAWHQAQDLELRFGEWWRVWRSHVVVFWPRWRPWIAHEARIYVATNCTICASFGRWLEARRPVALRIVAAEDHPHRDLTRVTYDPGDGSPEEEGLAAVARAFEHIHLGWAWFGWCGRLPGIRAILQLLVDLCGGGPRRIPRHSAGPE